MKGRYLSCVYLFSSLKLFRGYGIFVFFLYIDMGIYDVYKIDRKNK